MKAFYKGLMVKDAFLCTLMTFLVATILYLSFVNISVLDPFEKAFKDFEFMDIFYAERFNKAQRNPKIVLVNIKHADRFQLAQAIEKIALQNPSAIGMDVIFKDRKLEFTDSILKEQLGKYENLVTAYYYQNDSVIENHSYFKGEKNNQGFINLNHEGQNSVIRDFVGVKHDASKAYAFATQIALKAGLIDENYVLEKLNNPLPINYIGNKDVFLNFDIEEILESDAIPALDNAMVLMGYLGNDNPQFDIEDKHFTPLNKSWIGRAAPDTFGLAVHANILNMITKKELIYKVNPIVIYSFAFLSSFFVILLSMRLYKKNSFVYDLIKKVVQLLFSVLVLYLALLLLQQNVYINVLPIILLSILGIEVLDFYEHLVIYLNKKYKWKSQLL